ncbi:MAG: dihydroorotase [Pseudomonadota bacterium]|nr:dihydroorotase [Pseudomonadota bacterium]
MRKSILITNALIVNEGKTFESDIRICSGRIDKIASSIVASETDKVLDAKGRWVLPGMIDDQVHFREPGLTAKGNLTSESAAAVAGGITSFMDMPNVNPATTTIDALNKKYDIARDRCHANYAFYLGATNDNVDEIRALRPGQACGIKVFMGASTGSMLVDNEKTLHSIFKDAQVLVATHCEDTPTILANEKLARERFGDDVPMIEHPLIRSEEACYKSSSKAVQLALEYGTRLHVLHLTTERELELFKPGPGLGKRITAEACVHHLFYSQDDYAELDTKIKCNPAIKKTSDRDALIQAVIDGRIDVIATDHAPHTEAEKAGNYFQVLAGLPLVQFALLMVLEHVQRGRFSIELATEKTSHAVADLFGIPDRGYIREGYWADLVIIDPAKPTKVRREDILYKCGWSPLEGYEFSSSIFATLVNGEIVWGADGATKQALGKPLIFQS